MQPILSILLFSFLVFTPSCKNKSRAESEADKIGRAIAPLPQNEPPYAKIPVPKEIPVAGFFKFIEEVVRQNDTLNSYHLTEHLLLRANPWLLDTLMHTDYYYQMDRGNFVYEQQKMVVLKPGDTLLIPGPKTAAVLLKKMAQTRLDINIPAFELRILEGDSALYTLPVRVGKSKRKYLEAAGRVVDLRTRTGSGEVIRINRYPIFIDPVDGKKFKFTKRDDKRTTLMPQIPWLETKINGGRYGQMIHPTTNPRSLGKPASNGCIGMREADAWRVYFYAPVGTKVNIRYDLETINEKGDTIRYNNVYNLRRNTLSASILRVADFGPGWAAGKCWCE
jgi:hypothetical protein